MISTGRHEFSHRDAELIVHTVCEGPAARLGHDLALVVEDWDAVLEAGDSPESCSLEVTARLDSLTVGEARGGAKAVSETDRREILRNAAKSLGTKSHPQLRFVSTSVVGTWEQGEVTGDLTLHGTTRAETFQVVRVGGHYRVGGGIRQSDYGIKPFSTMVGALRVGDSVIFEVSVPLR